MAVSLEPEWRKASVPDSSMHFDRPYLMIHKSRDRFSRLGSPSNPSIDHLRQLSRPALDLIDYPRIWAADRHFPEARVIPHTVTDSNGPEDILQCAVPIIALAQNRAELTPSNRFSFVPGAIVPFISVPTSRLN